LNLSLFAYAWLGSVLVCIHIGNEWDEKTKDLSDKLICIAWGKRKKEILWFYFCWMGICCLAYFIEYLHIYLCNLAGRILFLRTFPDFVNDYYMIFMNFNNAACSLEILINAMKGLTLRQHSINYIRHKYSLEPLPNWYLINSW